MGRALIFLCLMIGAGAAANATPWPPLRGELTGQFLVHGPGNFPPLHWTLAAKPEAGSHAFAVTVTAPGLKLNLTAAGPDASALVRWRLAEGEVDLAQWWQQLVRQWNIAGLPPDLTLTGVLRLSGEGTGRESDWQGTMQATITDGAAGSAAQKWNVPRFNAAALLARTNTGFLVQSFSWQAPEATIAGMPLRNLALEAEGDAQGRLRLHAAGVDALGGRIALRPFEIDPLNPVVDTTAELAGVSLAQLAALVPEALREASGQVSGRVEVKWSASLGPRVGAGVLKVAPESPADFRLSATPGFLTQHAPERIRLVPENWGVLSQWLSFENPAYETLRRIELGEMPLRIEDLSIELYPDGPEGARSAAVRVTARPAGGSVVEKVTFAINIAGPLDQILRLGTSDQTKLKFGTKP